MASFASRPGPTNVVLPRRRSGRRAGISANYTRMMGSSFRALHAMPSEPRSQLIYEDPLLAVFSKQGGQPVHNPRSWAHGFFMPSANGAFPLTAEALTQLRHSASRSNIFPTFSPSRYGSGVTVLTRSRLLHRYFQRMLRVGHRRILKLAKGGNTRDLFEAAFGAPPTETNPPDVPDVGVRVRHLALVEGLLESDVGAVDTQVVFRKRRARSDGIAPSANFMRARQFHLANPRPTRVVLPYRVLRAWPELAVSLVEVVGAPSIRTIAAGFAQVGLPLVGDVERGAWRYWPQLYGFACHTRSISMRHPATGAPLNFTVPPPREFVEWHHPAATGLYSVGDLDPEGVASCVERELDAIDAVVVSLREAASLPSPADELRKAVAAALPAGAATDGRMVGEGKIQPSLEALLVAANCAPPGGAFASRGAEVDVSREPRAVAVPAARTVLKHEAWQRRLAAGKDIDVGEEVGTGKGLQSQSAKRGASPHPMRLTRRDSAAWGTFEDPEL